MATKMNWKSLGRRTLSILLAIMMVIGMMGTAFAQGTSSDPYDVGDVVYTADQNTKPSGVIPFLTEWEYRGIIDSVWSCGRSEHSHSFGCLFGCAGEHDHEDSGCTMVEAGKAKWELVENDDSAGHLDIHINLTAKYTLDGTTYDANVILTGADYNSGNLTITSTGNVHSISRHGDSVDAGQYRFYGTFPVGTYENPINYTIELIKNVDFNINGETVTVPMTFEETVNYWSGNICESLLESNGYKNGSWARGEFVGGSMDFQLGASAATGTTKATLTIQKNVAGITLTEAETFTFGVYNGSTKVDTVELTISAGGTTAIGTTALSLNETYYVVEEGAPVIDGYTLTTTVDGKNGTTSDSFTLTGDKAVVFTNTYTADPVYYDLTVNYVDTNGNVIADQVVENDILEGTAYTTEQKTIEGYTFEETTGDVTSGTMDADKVVTYVYSKNPDPTYQITYRVEGDAPATSSDIPAGETGILAGEAKTVEPGLTTTETTKNGVVGTWTFNGWVTTDASVENGAFEMPGSDVEFVGTWTFEAAPLYEITYRVEGDAPATSSDIPAGETGILAGETKTVEAGLTTTETTKDGVVGTWTFNGWTTSDAAIEDSAFEMPGNDVEFIGTWTFEAAPLYDITYRVEGDAPATSSDIPAGETGILAGASKTVEAGLTTTETTKNGVVGTWTFNGWVTSDATVQNGAFKMPDNDVEFVGTWTFVAAPTYGYTVIAEYYTNNAQDASKNIAAVEGVLVLPTADEVAKNYKNSNAVYNGNSYSYTGISENGSVYILRYDRTTYNISYRVEGDAPASHSDIPAGETGILAGASKTVEAGLTTTETTKNGVVGTWTFNGWTTSDATVENGTFKMPGNNVEFIGAWTFEVAPTYTVTVYRVDENGNNLLAPTSVSGLKSGMTYSSSLKTIEGYTFQKMADNSDAASGTITDRDIVVVYVYEKLPDPTYTVTVYRVDENGNDLLAPTSVSGLKSGMSYSSSLKTIEGYTFKEMADNSDAATGTITDRDIVVTYVYEKLPDPTYTVTVYRVDETGNDLLAPASVSGLKSGMSYSSSLKTIEGYTFKEMAKDSDPASGTITDHDIVVTYIYSKDEIVVPPPAPTYTVTVYHVDENGNDLMAPASVSGMKSGMTYSSSLKTIEGYTFKEMAKDSDPASGTIADRDIVVVYVYEKLPDPTYTVTVYRVDEAGNDLLAPASVSGLKSGMTYSSSLKTIEGYTFQKMADNSDPAAGTITDRDIVVTYIYSKDEIVVPPPAPTYTVTVYRVDENGNDLLAPSSVSGLKSGMTYSSRLKTIEGYTFQKMADNSDAASGTITDRDIVVTYVYSKDEVVIPPAPTYDYTVVAEYYTNGSKDGSKDIASVADVLALPTTDEVANTYKADNADYAGLTYTYAGISKDGNVYTLRYERTHVEPNLYTLNVRWISEDGDALAKQLFQIKAEGAEYNTEQKSFEGYTFVRTEGDAVSGIMDDNKAVTYIYTKNAPPVDPPVDPVDPPVDPVEPPVDPVEPPVDPVDPPVDPVEPPVDPVEPPVDPVEPPVDPVEPPVDPVEPPVDPVEPPVDPEDPEDPIDIPDEDVPLAEVPQTGDISVFFMALTSASAAGLIGLGVTRKKKDEE